MTKLRELYKCGICGNVTEVQDTGATALVCCGVAMDLLEAKTEDAGLEKHVPVVEPSENGVKVKVGSIPHPMTEDHAIKFIEVLTKDKVLKAELDVEGAAEAEFCLCSDEVVEVRSYCNLHDLWKA